MRQQALQQETITITTQNNNNVGSVVSNPDRIKEAVDKGLITVGVAVPDEENSAAYDPSRPSIQPLIGL